MAYFIQVFIAPNVCLGEAAPIILSTQSLNTQQISSWCYKTHGISVPLNFIVLLLFFKLSEF